MKEDLKIPENSNLQMGTTLRKGTTAKESNLIKRRQRRHSSYQSSRPPIRLVVASDAHIVDLLNEAGEGRDLIIQNLLARHIDA